LYHYPLKVLHEEVHQEGVFMDVKDYLEHNFKEIWSCNVSYSLTVKQTWFELHFDLVITQLFQAWDLNGFELGITDLQAPPFPQV